MSEPPGGMLKRRDVHPSPLIDGRPAANGAGGRFSRQVQRLLVSKGEREEAELEHRIRTQPGVTRPNIVAIVSPKGGVGKTTSTFLVGNLLASHLKLRVIAVDANPDFGTLARLSPDERRSQRSLADLLEDADRLKTAAELSPYVSRQPSGLHLLAAPRDPELTASLGPDRYGELAAFLSCFYEVVLLDLGTGVAGPLASFAIDRADQVVLVTTPEWVTATVVLEALSHLQHERTTIALNKSLLRSSDVPLIEGHFRAEHLHRCVTIPYDEQLASMLDTGSYTLDALARPTRLAIRRLGLSVAEQLV
ncbi:MAG: MinD/ParA family protein [Actinomycetota bacterium]|nr:MinD/ParA family protein [Actinomycetota bacterium]